VVRYYRCESPRRYDFDRLNDRMIPVRCETLDCEGCRRRAVARRSTALAGARPERYLVLTGVPDTYVKFSAMRRKLSTNLERAGYPLGEWAITIEINPRGHHANVLTHSAPAIPERLLSECATRAGCAPRVYSQPVDSPEAVSRYMLKDATATATATATDPERAAAFLTANGGRLTNTSHGYFRDEDGAPLRAKAADAYPRSHSSISAPDRWSQNPVLQQAPDQDLSPLDALRLSDADFDRWMLRQRRKRSETRAC